jgi:hypothetical protein
VRGVMSDVSPHTHIATSRENRISD